MGMKLKKLEETYSILKLPPRFEIPSWATEGGFFAINRTPDELSIVCESRLVPEDVETQSRDWSCLRVDGLLDFAQTGILSSIAGPLARAKISIFAISTSNTDYILVKNENLDKAVESLRKSGFVL